MIQEAFKTASQYLAMLTEFGAAIIIGLAAIQALFQSLRGFFRFHGRAIEKETIRLQLARWLSLGLEFELAADILRTAVTPTWNEIGQLAAIVVLRTALNYFIHQEIDRANRASHDK